MKHPIMGKRYAFAGLLAISSSTVTIVTMAQLRTDGYDHFHKAISELGSLDAPNKWVFNLVGYIIPGFLISYFTRGLGRSWQHKHSFFITMLSLSGLFLSVAGLFPMDRAHRSSWTSLLHTVGSLGSGTTWLVGGLGNWWILRKEAGWHHLALPVALLPILAVVSVLLVPADKPALGQRLAFGCYFLFIGLLSVWLLRLAEHSSKHEQSRESQSTTQG